MKMISKNLAVSRKLRMALTKMEDKNLTLRWVHLLLARMQINMILLTARTQTLKKEEEGILNSREAFKELQEELWPMTEDRN